jgi:hypothetical protein
MVYKVVRVLHGEGKFDGLIDVELRRHEQGSHVLPPD